MENHIGPMLHLCNILSATSCPQNQLVPMLAQYVKVAWDIFDEILKKKSKITYNLQSSVVLFNLIITLNLMFSPQIELGICN